MEYFSFFFCSNFTMFMQWKSMKRGEKRERTEKTFWNVVCTVERSQKLTFDFKS